MAEDTTNYDDRTIGRRLKHVRLSRKKSLRAIAELGGISAGHLSRIERGERALDRRSVLVALANALEISPSELTALPVPAPADGNSDSSISAVRRALMSVTTGRPGGEVQPIDQLRHRAAEVEKVSYDDRGLTLPSLITDVHTTLADGSATSTDHAALLRTAVMMHAQTVRGWLLVVGAPLDLRWQASLLARGAAGELDDATFSGVVTWGSVVEMISSGAFDLARDELDATTVPTTTNVGLQLDGMLALSRSLVAASDNRRAEVAASLEHAADLARRTGQGNAFRMGFGPVNVGVWRMAASLESDEPDDAVRIAEQLQPTEHPSRERRATYWIDYGRALTRVRRRDDAVRALRHGEKLFPMRLSRNPFARDTLAELVSHSPKDPTINRELLGMAYRAGLPI